MGHTRLGRLPKTQRWQALVNELYGPTPDAQNTARTTLWAADNRLRELGSDPSLGKVVWLLTRITWAARSDDFLAELADVGIQTRPDEPVLSFISKVADRVRDDVAVNVTSGMFGEVSSLALRRTLMETIGEQGNDLFHGDLGALQRSLRLYSTQVRFGQLSQRFFGDLLARTLTAAAERGLSTPNPSSGQSPGPTLAAREAVDGIALHARQAARILRDFAGAWYSKHNWESKGRITQEEADGFTRHALRKLRAELRLEADE